MNPIKLTLLFSLFTTIIFGQQEYPGYVVRLEGDTLRGRIVITPDIIKFRYEGVKTKYSRSELSDYGYYANKVFFPKPDKNPPTKKSETKGIIVLVTGDTLHNFYITSIRPENIRGYFEYPNYIDYQASDNELSELIIKSETRNDLIDLIVVEDFPKKGGTFFMYAKRVFDSGLRAYNIDNRHPFNKLPNKSPDTYFPAFGIVGAVATELIKENYEPELINTNGGYDDWIIYKNGKVYNINSIPEWKKKFTFIFEGDIGFPEYLEKNKIKRTNIRAILKAYGDFK
jgi:hypothetical protein